jgi:acetamidase/formamidase
MSTDADSARGEADYHLSAAESNVHYEWNNGIDPALTVQPGETVRFDCRDSWDRLVDAETTVADLPRLTADKGGMPLTGPVAVAGATPGDVLVVEILGVEHDDWGWTVFRPGHQEVGLLPDEFPEWGLHYWELDPDAGIGHYVDGVEIPLDPFPGTVGVAPGADGDHSTTPPRNVGGNMDTKHLTAGTTLYLPVESAGALFSIGDGHATQGDGEVCGGAVETPIRATVRFDVRRDISIEYPQYHMPDGDASLDGPAYSTMGIGPDLMEAAKSAVSEMVAHVHQQRGLSREKAYILTSVVADLRINEVVDRPNWAVSAHLPESIFPE